MKKRIAIIILLIIIVCNGFYFAQRLNLIPQKYYTCEDFGIETIQSEIDYNGNGSDDYTDILIGARQDAENNLTLEFFIKHCINANFLIEYI